MLKRPLKMFRFARKLEAEKEMLLSWTDSLIQDLDKLCAALARNGLSAQTEIENQKKAIDLLMSQKKVLEDTIEELKKKQNELRAENVRLKDLFEKIRDRMTTTAGVDAIRMERIRQIEKEGWTEEYDDQLRGEELSNAAVCYAFLPR
jgi:septal ring factor EnvC (AmiA/AmiB activator)